MSSKNTLACFKQIRLPFRSKSETSSQRTIDNTKNIKNTSTNPSSITLSTPPRSPPTLFTIPFELRLIIYSFIPKDLFQRGLAWQEPHPLYALLFVNQFLRTEISSLLYRFPIFKFTSPHRCLFFLTWTLPDIQRLNALRITCPTHDTYALEPIWELLSKENVPLEKLAIVLLNVNSDAKTPPKGRLLPNKVAWEALKLANAKSAELIGLLDKELDPSYDYCPNTTSTSVERAQSSSASALGSLKSIRFLSTNDTPIGYWASEFELAVLRLDARIFETAAREGLRVKTMISLPVIAPGATTTPQGFEVLDLRLSGKAGWKYRFKWFADKNLWCERSWGVEGSFLEEGEEQLTRMGRRNVEDEFAVCAFRGDSAFKLWMGMNVGESSERTMQVQVVWSCLDLN